jgi:poly-beta-1,6-N-acetyl-D-glucosamine synthase
VWLTTLAVVLTALYVGVMLLIAVGMRRPPPRTRSAGAWPSVDLIIPAHDESARIEPTLAAVAALAYPGELRVIVVDDRSSDDTAAIVRRAMQRDPRLRLLRILRPSRRLAPKVAAVAQGVSASDGDVIVTTDADCTMAPDWLQAMIDPLRDDDVVMTLGPVTTLAFGAAGGLRARMEAIDWLSLMLVSRSLTRLGFSLASSANAQAYRRSAFLRSGGFGVSGRAPSGDEDLLAQQLGALPGARTVFLDDPAARVVTRGTAGWRAWLAQRRRWVSRYHHVDRYPPAFWGAIALLGGHSVALMLAAATLPFHPTSAAPLGIAWGTKLLIEIVGVGAALRQFGRSDLIGPALVAWAVTHPLLIALASVTSLLRPGSWRAGARSYRRRAWRARMRRGRARLRQRWRRPPGSIAP